MLTPNRCPRCGQVEESMQYPAGSRAVPERDIDVCGPCGSDEAVGRGLVPVTQWPIGPNQEVYR